MGMESYKLSGDARRRHVESSGRGVVASGGWYRRLGKEHAMHSAVSADAVLASLDVPSRGPVHPATRWETRPTTCCCKNSRDARGRQTFASIDRYVISLHERIRYSVVVLAGGVDSLSTISRRVKPA